MEILPEDRIFAVLPLYHLGCGAVALSHMYCIGSTIVLGRRFSAKDFFPDLVKYKCTVSLWLAIVSIDYIIIVMLYVGVFLHWRAMSLYSGSA